jgi:hypothetical protein
MFSEKGAALAAPFLFVETASGRSFFALKQAAPLGGFFLWRS